MGLKNQRTNPFYALLLVAGLAFVVTACAYGVMTYLGTRGQVPESGLLVFLARHGVWLLLVEVAVVFVAGIAAMLTDNFWTRPQPSPSAEEQP
jgi:hypothetical protein